MGCIESNISSLKNGIFKQAKNQNIEGGSHQISSNLN
jgi:hypothetical protein